MNVCHRPTDSASAAVLIGSFIHSSALSWHQLSRCRLEGHRTTWLHLDGIPLLRDCCLSCSRIEVELHPLQPIRLGLFHLCAIHLKQSHFFLFRSWFLFCSVILFGFFKSRCTFLSSAFWAFLTWAFSFTLFTFGVSLAGLVTFLSPTIWSFVSFLPTVVTLDVLTWVAFLSSAFVSFVAFTIAFTFSFSFH